MSRWLLRLLPFLVLLFILPLLLGACGPVAQAQTQTPPTRAAQPATPVEAATVQTGKIDQIFDYTGTLQPQKTVSIAPLVTGHIQSMLVDVGAAVKTGDPIAVIKPDTFQVQLDQANAALTNARLNLAKMQEGSRPEQITAAQAAVDLARANLNDVANVNDNERTVAATNLANAETAVRQAQTAYDKIAWAGNISDTPQAAALEQATITYQSALASYNLGTHPSDSTLAPLMSALSQAELNLALIIKPYTDIELQIAQVQVQQAAAAAELARLQLAETTIKAPFDGVIAARYVDEGSMVGPQTPLVLFLSKDVEVLVNVEEEQIAQLATNQNAGLHVTAYPNQDFPAVVTSIAPAGDQGTHTFAVKVTPANPGGQLRSGMYANVSILVKKDQNVVLAPRAAVTLVNGNETVYVVKDNTVEQRTVTTGLTNADYIEIVSGLQPGETVVTAGQSNLVNGAKVKIVKNT